MTWADLLVRGLLFLAVSVEGCIPFNHIEYAYTNDDDEKTTFGTEDSSLVNTFLVDSGASVHCCSKAELFTRFTEHQPNKRVKVASGAFVAVHAIGDIELTLPDQNGKLRKITLHGVFYCPDLKVDLVSTKRLWRDNKIKTSLHSTCVLKDKSGGENDGCKFTLASTCKQYLLHSRKKASIKRNQTVNALALEGGLTQDKVEPGLSEIMPSVLHARLGHTAATRIRRAYHTGDGIPNVDFDDLSRLECDGCDKGGSRKPVFHSRPTRFKFTSWGQRIHSDLCGPFPPDVHGNIYALCFVDAYSGEAEVVFLKSKTSQEVKDAFQTFVKRNKERIPPVMEWFTDNGGEFMSKDLERFCEEFAVKRSFSIPYCPPQNGKAERLWGIVLRGTRIALAHSGMPEHFWSYAMLDALWLHNHLPSRSNDKFLPPITVSRGLVPDFSRKRVWGCKCYFHLSDYDVNALKLSKVGPTAVEAVCLGFDPMRHGYRVFVPSLNRITSAYKPKFREQHFLRFTKHGQRVPDVFDYDDLPITQLQKQHTAFHKGDGHLTTTLDTTSPDPTPVANDNPMTQQMATDPNMHLRPALDPRHGTVSTRMQHGFWNANHCPRTECTLPNGHAGLHSYERVGTGSDGPPANRLRSQNRVVHFVDEFTESYADHFAFSIGGQDKDEWVLKTTYSGSINIPKTYEEAMASPQADLWKAAMDKEIKDLMLHDTWDAEVQVPHGRKVTKSKWVFDVKYNRDGTVDRFKARFVVCGYSQVQGFDYDRAFSATLRATSFRCLIAQASARKLKLEQMDVTNAFTQAPIDDVDIFVECAKGYGSKPIKLKKALYGTKQASRLWQETLRNYLLEESFTQSVVEPCMYSKTLDDGRRIIVAVYVDDLVVAHNDDILFTKFKEGFLKRFRAKHLGPLSWFLGIAVDRDSKGVYHLHQGKYINDLIGRFVQAKGKHSVGRDIPMTPEAAKSLRHANDDAERARVKELPYLQLVGSLLYLAVMTRPDIMASMSLLCMYMNDPSEDCYEAALGVLLYVSKTKDLGLSFSGSRQHQGVFSSDIEVSMRTNNDLHAFSDSSWGKAYPLHGFCVFMNGGPVSYSSRALKIVADSSAEAEYAACSLCAKELVFVRELCRDMGFEIQGSIVMGVDNTAAIDIAKDVGVTKRNKHFERALHYIRKEINMLRMLAYFVPTGRQVADIFTKVLDVKTFLLHRRYIFGR